jgi:hypothetical protein
MKLLQTINEKEPKKKGAIKSLLVQKHKKN